jgi:hypothetical protein
MTTEYFSFYLQNRLIQTSKTGGQWYSYTSPFSIPWLMGQRTLPSVKREPLEGNSEKGKNLKGKIGNSNNVNLYN